MLCLAYQYGEDPDNGHREGSSASLSVTCFHRARALLAVSEEDSEDSIPHFTMVQAYLLLQICAMMYLCGNDSAYGLKMHSRMVSHARAGALLQPLPIESKAAGDLESLWKDFIKTESLMPASMRVVGVLDGDVKAALIWARKVFQRRRRWRVGRMIMTCLDSIEE
ncbi:putative C2H2-type domain-containing protein [Seiridium cardinale]|uniref:C2H2-type domain-containing protein n=1 Tax=Seiridium cardinale TaxID=138064 RepID=A0ABR2X594_9PEZI